MRFVLVHGAMHGAWCRDRLVPELAALGYEAVVVDLPGHGTRRNEVATLESYGNALAGVVEQDDVLVGHSMGGTVITLAADAIDSKVGHLIYLAAPVPHEGKSLADVMSAYTGTPGQEFSESEFWMRDTASLGQVFYHHTSRA